MLILLGAIFRYGAAGLEPSLHPCVHTSAEVQWVPSSLLGTSLVVPVIKSIVLAICFRMQSPMIS